MGSGNISGGNEAFSLALVQATLNGNCGFPTFPQGSAYAAGVWDKEIGSRKKTVPSKIKLPRYKT